MSLLKIVNPYSNDKFHPTIKNPRNFQIAGIRVGLRWRREDEIFIISFSIYLFVYFSKIRHLLFQQENTLNLDQTLFIAKFYRTVYIKHLDLLTPTLHLLSQNKPRINFYLAIYQKFATQHIMKFLSPARKLQPRQRFLRIHIIYPSTPSKSKSCHTFLHLDLDSFT